MPRPPDVWNVYGAYRPIDRAAMLRTNNEFWQEEDAWARAMQLRLDSENCDLVIVHTTYRPGKGEFSGKSRPVRRVLWRCGAGKAWFE